MRVLVAGSSGFLGSRLVDRLTADGHQVIRLVRRTAGAGEVTWDPYAGPLDPATLDGIDVVVNLAGTPTMGNPHSRKWAHDLRHSRVTTTRVLAEAIAAAPHHPAYLAGNAIAWYGDHGDEPVTEDSDSRGDALLADVTRQWQQATRPAADAGARVVVLRTSPVLDATGAPLKQLRLLYSLGLGGPLGSGRQYFPVISTRDWIGAAAHLITSDVAGPVNMTAPVPPTNAEFSKAIARAVHRPAFLRVPAVAIKVAAGPLAPEVLGSVRAVPARLLDDGYGFADSDIDAMLAAAL
jgi:uncharacterized protein (TIGR01777 family)